MIKFLKSTALAVAASLLVCFCSADNQDAELLNGVLEAVHFDVRTEVAGGVVSVRVEEGQPVSAGDIIIELDTDKLELQERAAQAELTAQRAKLEAMEKGARAQELEQARLLLEQARTQYDKAQKDYERLERLYRKDAVSEFEMENARVRRDLARDQMKQVEERYNLVLEGVRDEELKAQLAVVDAVEAKLALARIQLNDASIKSPVDGTLVERYLELGELAMPGAMVATVANYRRLELQVYVAEDVVGQIRLGQLAEVMADSFPGEVFTARVIRKSEEAEFTPKNVQTREERTTLVYEVTLLVDNPQGHAIAGLPADARFLDQIDEKYAATTSSPKEPDMVHGSTEGEGEGPGPLPAETVRPGGTASPGEPE